MLVYDRLLAQEQSQSHRIWNHALLQKAEQPQLSRFARQTLLEHKRRRQARAEVRSRRRAEIV
jgi:hypothetical protein